ncbi:MAG: 4-alpha-glucanotransferase [Gammaproteobacteria bacterium]|nr:4-alpha-glucanotransferase [Gammaproteobacteria bacterium]
MSVCTKQQPIFEKRQAGVILHPTSLPGPNGQGELGPEAYHFVDFLNDCGLSVWQVLPMNPTHEDRSPYMNLSVFAGNTDFISLTLLAEWGWLPANEALTDAGKRQKLVIARQQFLQQASTNDKTALQQFINQHQYWLADYALFQAIKNTQGNKSWVDWPVVLRDREAGAIRAATHQLQDAIEQINFEQFVFFKQWLDLKQYANDHNVKMVGDMPIFVAHDSAEVWKHRKYFDLNADGSPRTIAGVPPDYFSATGQRWGNPLYLWERMKEAGYQWWIERCRVGFALYDAIRIDHFRGFESFWEIDAKEKTAENGHWVKGPGATLFKALLQSQPPLSSHQQQLAFIAEDLGIITEEVNALRQEFGWPGMKILQFAFDGDATNAYLPHNAEQNSVMYTGTHDNDTTLSWYEQLPEHEKKQVMAYLADTSEAMPWALIRSALASVSNWALFPMQDLLSLGQGHRMNTPGVTADNWRWRFQWDQVVPGIPSKIKSMTKLYGR